MLNKAVSSHQVAELNGMWIRHTLKPEIHIPSQHKWIDQGRQTIQDIRELREEGDGHLR